MNIAHMQNNKKIITNSLDNSKIVTTSCVYVKMITPINEEYYAWKTYFDYCTYDDVFDCTGL